MEVGGGGGGGGGVKKAFFTKIFMFIFAQLILLDFWNLHLKTKLSSKAHEESF